MARSSVAQLLLETQRFEEAEPVAPDLLADQREALGDENLFTQISIDSLVRIPNNLDRHEDEERDDLEAISLSESTLGPRHDGTLVSLTHLAKCYADQGEWTSARHVHRNARAPSASHATWWPSR
ncbi:MAG: tetratricopeptide repeat protein [Planctomycetota bacterium]